MTDAAVDALRTRLIGLGVETASGSSHEIRCRVGADGALGLLRQLQADADAPMRRLVDLTAIDFEGEPRFELVYVLHAPGPNLRLRIHVPVEGDPPTVESATSLWRGAEWLEREVFDLFGIRFRGHPNLRRILLSEDFEGAPLRKDYPLRPDLGLPREVER